MQAGNGYSLCQSEESMSKLADGNSKSLGWARPFEPMGPSSGNSK